MLSHYEIPIPSCSLKADFSFSVPYIMTINLYIWIYICYYGDGAVTGLHCKKSDARQV
jgi:hypothetical protein